MLTKALQKTNIFEKKIIKISGFIPVKKLKKLNNEIKKINVIVILNNTKENEEKPVKLKNNKFFKNFEVILKTFSGISYNEFDKTWAVGILFIIFGSLCLLDAGYGFMLSITGLLLYKISLNKKIAMVFFTTGFFSILLGLLSGQIFGYIIGQDFLKQNSPLIDIAINPLPCFKFSLIVGIFSMMFGCILSILQNSLKTSSTGNLILNITILIIFLNITLEINKNINLLLIILISLTIALWILYPDNIFELKLPNIIWTIYYNSTGIIQDILSHMRLFGISLSGAILALVVNKISNMFPIYISILFSLITHVFVFLLALLSLYIHTNRLIFLEFGNKCLKGGHFFYSPLKRVKI